MTPRRARSRTGSRALEERAFHRWLAGALPWGSERLLPLGDDAAALRAPPGSAAVVSTDALVEGTHFLRESPPRKIGHAAAAVSLSDVASKGAEPKAVLLSLVAPPGTPERWARELLLGAEHLAAAYGAHVVGGDTKAGPTRTVVGTAFGWAAPTSLVARSGARPGDVLVTTGRVGWGGASARGMESGAPSRRRAVERMLMVTPRVEEGRALARYATAMLDTSDGLAESCWLLAAASRVRLDVEEEALPWDPRIRGRPRPERRKAGFYGGDYELLATLPQRALAAARRGLEHRGTQLTAIGVVRPGRGAYLLGAEARVPMPHSSWQPFRRGRRF